MKICCASGLNVKGFSMHFENGQCTVMKDGEMYCQAVTSKGVFKLLHKWQQINTVQTESAGDKSMELWHCQSHRDIQKPFWKTQHSLYLSR